MMNKLIKQIYHHCYKEDNYKREIILLIARLVIRRYNLNKLRIIFIEVVARTEREVTQVKVSSYLAEKLPTV